ncbi:MAG: hypothetical protein MUC88_09415 [Planctomycetes bacterium]|jgi:hypothetical protein|nr:hypothetical protein [Planctomycetota bacterium]
MSGGILSAGASLTRCYDTGAVAGINAIGHLVAVNDRGAVTQCYHTGAVSGNSRVGGLVGGNGGPITYCYSMGPVSGAENVGGLVGANEDDMAGSFWNTQTSGQVKSVGGTGKTTAQMQTVSTFMAVGWDFVGIPWARQGTGCQRDNQDSGRLPRALSAGGDDLRSRRFGVKQDLLLANRRGQRG